MGGEKANANIVVLTPREHFLCHMLMVKMFDGHLMWKMARAAVMLKAGSRNAKHASSRLYEMARRLQPKHTEEAKAKISRKRTGSKSSNAARAAMATAQRLRWQSAEARKKQQITLTALYEEDELRQKIGRSVKKALANHEARARVGSGVSKKWKDGVWKTQILEARKTWQQTDEHRTAMSIAVSASINDVEKARRSNRLKKLWADPVWRANMLAKRKK